MSIINIAKDLNIPANKTFYLVANSGQDIDDIAAMLKNPYYFSESGNMLYNSEDVNDPMALGLLVQGRIKPEFPAMATGMFKGRYFYFSETGQVREKKNKRTWLDILNFHIGNVFLREEDMTDKEWERIRTLYNAFKSGDVGCIVLHEGNKGKMEEMFSTEGENLKGMLSGIFQKNINQF